MIKICKEQYHTIWREWLMLVEMVIVGLCLYNSWLFKTCKAYMIYITCLLINMFAKSGWIKYENLLHHFLLYFTTRNKENILLWWRLKKKLETVLRKCNKYCLKLGMGREIFSLEWGDINCDFSWIIIIQLISHIY